MASRVLISNYQLGVTKLWMHVVQKKHVSRITKINMWLKSFFFFFFAKYALQVITYFLYKTNAGFIWHFDLFLFKALKNFFNMKELILQNIDERTFFVVRYYGRRRPYSAVFRTWALRSDSYSKISLNSLKILRELDFRIRFLAYKKNFRNKKTALIFRNKYKQVKEKFLNIKIKKYLKNWWRIVKDKVKRKIKYNKLCFEKKKKYHLTSFFFKKLKYLQKIYLYQLKKKRQVIKHYTYMEGVQKGKVLKNYKLLKLKQKKLLVCFLKYFRKNEQKKNLLTYISQKYLINMSRVKIAVIHAQYKILKKKIKKTKNQFFKLWLLLLANKFTVKKTLKWSSIKYFKKNLIYKNKKKKIKYRNKLWILKCRQRNLKLKQYLRLCKKLAKTSKMSILKKRFFFLNYLKKSYFISKKSFLVKTLLNKKSIKQLRLLRHKKLCYKKKNNLKFWRKKLNIKNKWQISLFKLHQIYCKLKAKKQIKNLKYINSSLFIYSNFKQSALVVANPLREYFWQYLKREKNFIKSFILQRRRKWLAHKNFKLFMTTELMMIFRSLLEVNYIYYTIKLKKTILLDQIQAMWDWSKRNINYPKKDFHHIYRLLYLFRLSFQFNDFFYFLHYFVYFFENKKRTKDRVILGLYRTILKSLRIPGVDLRGLRFTFAGKFNRKPRARTITVRKGAPMIPFQQMDLKVQYCARTVLTNFGLYYMRLWVYHYNHI